MSLYFLLTDVNTISLGQTWVRMSRFETELFVPPPDPDLICPICQCVLDDPVECLCRHVFCRLCIETWLKKHFTCPTCRKTAYCSDLKYVFSVTISSLSNIWLIKIMWQIWLHRNIYLCMYTVLFNPFQACASVITERFEPTYYGVPLSQKWVYPKSESRDISRTLWGLCLSDVGMQVWDLS